MRNCEDTASATPSGSSFTPTTPARSCVAFHDDGESMSEQDRNEWSNALRNKYGIAVPEAEPSFFDLHEEHYGEEDE